MEEKWFKTEMEKSITTPSHTYCGLVRYKIEQFDEPEG